MCVCVCVRVYVKKAVLLLFSSGVDILESYNVIHPHIYTHTHPQTWSASQTDNGPTATAGARSNSRSSMTVMMRKEEEGWRGKVLPPRGRESYRSIKRCPCLWKRCVCVYKCVIYGGCFVFALSTYPLTYTHTHTHSHNIKQETNGNDGAAVSGTTTGRQIYTRAHTREDEREEEEGDSISPVNERGLALEVEEGEEEEEKGGGRGGKKKEKKKNGIHTMRRRFFNANPLAPSSSGLIFDDDDC